MAARYERWLRRAQAVGFRRRDIGLLAMLCLAPALPSLAQDSGPSGSVMASGAAHADASAMATRALKSASEILNLIPDMPMSDPQADELARRRALARNALDEIYQALAQAGLNRETANALETRAWALAHELGGPEFEAEAHARLAVISLSLGRTQAAETSLREGWRARSMAADHIARDRAAERLVAAAVLSPETAREAWRNAWSIESATPRIRSLETLARALAGFGDVSDAARAAIREADADTRDRKLFDLAKSLMEAGLSEPALAVLLAADNEGLRRDKALTDLVEREIGWRKDPALIVAHRAIEDAPLRDTATARAAAYQLSSSLVADALFTAETIEAAPARAGAFLRISGVQLDRQYLGQAAALLGRIEVMDGIGSDLRKQLQTQQAALAIGLDDAEGAMALWPDVAGYAAHLAPPLGDVLRKDLRDDDLLRLAAAAPTQGVASRLAADALEALARRTGDPEAVEDLLTELPDPVSRSAALLRLVGEDTLWSDLAVWPAQMRMRWLGQARSLLGEAGAGQDDLRRDLIRLLGRFDSYAAAMAESDRLPESVRLQPETQSVLAVVEVRRGKFREALLRTQQLTGSGRAKAIAEVAGAFMQAGLAREALLLVRQIDPWAIRVRAFRRLAELHADAMQTEFTASAARARGAGPLQPPIRPPTPLPEAARDVTPLFADSGFRFYRAPPLPAIDLADDLNLRDVDARAVRAAVPAPAPGRLRMAYAHYDRHNRSYLTEAYDLDLLKKTQGVRRPQFLFLEDGVFDLPAVAHALQAQGRAEVLARAGRTYYLRAPLLVGPGATLLITGLDVDSLRLSSEGGAALINAGHVHVVDSEIVGWSEIAAAPATATYKGRGSFRPFYLAWSGSKTWAAEARFANLGYQASGRYGASFSAGPKELISANAPPPQAVISHSLFANMLYGLHTSNAGRLAAVGNVFENSIVYGASPRGMDRQSFFALNTAIGTLRKHGFLVGGFADGTLWRGNVAVRNAGSGLAVEQGGAGSRFVANLMLENSGDGVSLRESACVLLAGNVLAHNRRSGVAVRNSAQIALYSNNIRDNVGTALSARSAHIEKASAGLPAMLPTDLTIANNVLQGQASLMKFDAVSAVTLGDNRLIGPKLVGGAARVVEAELIGYAGRGVTMASECAPQASSTPCPLVASGLVVTAPTDHDACPAEKSAAQSSASLWEAAR